MYKQGWMKMDKWQDSQEQCWFFEDCEEIWEQKWLSNMTKLHLNSTGAPMSQGEFKCSWMSGEMLTCCLTRHKGFLDPALRIVLGQYWHFVQIKGKTLDCITWRTCMMSLQAHTVCHTIFILRVCWERSLSEWTSTWSEQFVKSIMIYASSL